MTPTATILALFGPTIFAAVGVLVIKHRRQSPTKWQKDYYRAVDLLATMPAPVGANALADAMLRRRSLGVVLGAAELTAAAVQMEYVSNELGRMAHQVAREASSASK